MNDARDDRRGDDSDARGELPRDPSEEGRVPSGPGVDPAWDRGDTSGPERDPNLDRGGPEGEEARSSRGPLSG